ncbi:hypothetical protein [Caenimonas soli]|uniref:hypothetical protein n=1 Tax=Caenimonas soli TaxID=2735555 RepID=UPI0015577E23|nr:hypothetical protein [Caenimonas soli]NPC56025.1 hypothetical protein [Caenimonas soli]
MPLVDLLPEENALVFACLKCVASGRVIPHDWEFQTLLGVEPAQVVAVVDAWPNVDESDEIVGLAINNSLNSLLGLVSDDLLRKHLAYGKSQIAAVFSKWRGSTSSVHEPREV